MSAAPRTIDTSSLQGSAPAPLVPVRRVDKLVEQASLIMMPTGVVFIILGWAGASRTPLAFEQIPYLISGGLLGLGLMIGGGLLYVGGWIARMSQMLPSEAPVTGLVSMLQGLVGGSGPTAPVGSFLRTPSGTMFHRPDCSIVLGRGDAVAVSESQAKKFKPCGMCDPMVVA